MASLARQLSPPIAATALAVTLWRVISIRQYHQRAWHRANTALATRLGDKTVKAAAIA